MHLKLVSMLLFLYPERKVTTRFDFCCINPLMYVNTKLVLLIFQNPEAVDLNMHGAFAADLEGTLHQGIFSNFKIPSCIERIINMEI